MSNLLWRIQNGEMPRNLNPKVWWLLIGANDLVRGECSEEAIILGILRLAEEIYTLRPESVVVIQGLLPRTFHPDGSLTLNKKLSAQASPGSRRLRKIFMGNRTQPNKFNNNPNKKQYYKRNQYPLWPSIQLINQELARFCEKHEHIVYFDAASLFLGSLGNEHYQSAQKFILKDLMPDYAHLNAMGYEVMAKVIAKELSRIIYDNDETNHQATASGQLTRKLKSCLR
jgi:lysophospholipase L1-like esterase